MAIVPTLGGLVRARNDCFITLDLDPGNLRLPLFAALLVALEQAHGHSPFCWRAGEGPPCGLMVILGMLTEGLLEIYNAANSWNPTNERN